MRLSIKKFSLRLFLLTFLYFLVNNLISLLPLTYPNLLKISGKYNKNTPKDRPI